MLVPYRRLVTPTPDSTQAPYVALNAFWDDVKRVPYYRQEQSQVDDSSELPVGVSLARYPVRPGLVRVVRYGGDWQIYTEDEGVTGGPGSGGACTLAAPFVNPNPAMASRPGVADASFSVTGSLGAPPYQIAIREQQSPAVLALATSASSQQPALFTGFAPGRYEATITDAAGCARATRFEVYAGSGDNGPYGPDLRVSYSPGAGLFRFFWNPVTKAVETFDRPPLPGESTTDDYDNYTPPGTPVDGYLLSNGYTWRAVYSDGTGGVYFTDTDTRQPGLLELNNLILFHPDRPEEVGGALIECNATDYPLSFQLLDAAGVAVGAPNATGHFDGLSADSYEVAVTDNEGRTLAVPFSLRVRYGKRWQLVADSLDSLDWSVEIWQIGYTGSVTAIYGQGDTPARLRSDGFSSALGGQGDIPAAIGTSLELNLLATLDQLADIQLGTDRDFRVDMYKVGALDFRGYVIPGIYTADLQSGKVPVSITAADGLAALKDTFFTGGQGRPLTGRWPILNTLLHCLSRCDVALPLRIATNRRPAEIATTQAPERYELTERAGYNDTGKNEPLRMRAVVEAIAQLLGGTLVQRAGAWEIRAAVEAAALSVPARAYQSAGSDLNTLPVTAPSGLIRPPLVARAANGWYWLKDSQALSIRAGWKSLTVSTDADYAANALPAGDVFSSDTNWNLALDALLPTAGWSENADSPGFPLALARAGEKNTDLGAIWPASQGASDTRYLQSGPLPNSPQIEDVPWKLQVVGLFAIPTIIGQPAPPAPLPSEDFVDLPCEIVIDGQRQNLPFLARFHLAKEEGQFTTYSVALPPLPAGARIARLRLYPCQGLGLLIPNAILLIKQVAIQLLPQGATWSGKDTFRADSNRGSVRPTEILQVFHPDVPLKAGLFEANAFAFRRAVSVVGGALTTVWQRPGDLRAAPLLESTAYDGLALRAAPSRLLKGIVRYYNAAPPRMLDTVDAPDDLDGRRFLVVALSDDLRAAEAEVTLVEVGVGTRLGTLDPMEGLPAGVRLIDGVTFPVGGPIVPGQGRPRVRATHHGLRITRQP